MGFLIKKLLVVILTASGESKWTWINIHVEKCACEILGEDTSSWVAAAVKGIITATNCAQHGAVSLKEMELHMERSEKRNQGSG